MFGTKSLFFRWVRKRFRADSITKIKGEWEKQQKGCFMQTQDWTKRSIKSEKCTYKLHFTFPSFRLKAFPTCCPSADTSGGTSNPWCDTIHLSPVQFAADFLSFIYGHLHNIADGRGQKTESVACYLWFTILIPTELQRLLCCLFYLNIIMKYECWNVLLLPSDSCLHSWCLLRHCWQILMLWNNITGELTSAVWLKHWDDFSSTPPPRI